MKFIGLVIGYGIYDCIKHIIIRIINIKRKKNLNKYLEELAFNEWHHNDANTKDDFQTGFIAGYKKALEQHH